MAIITLATPADPRIAEYAAVGDPELAQRSGLFVGEGRLLVRRLLQDGRYRVRSLLVSDAAQQQLADVLVQLDAEVPVFVCPMQSFRDITGFNLHRGCVALVERPPQPDVRQLLAGARLVVALESIANPDNVGGVFRNAAAFGADAVLVDSATGDPLYRKAIRTSMGAALQVPFARVDAVSATVSELRGQGFTVVALTPAADAAPLAEVAARCASDRVAIVVGHEGEGLTVATLDACEVRARIPMADGVDSLNVAAATAIAFYAMRRAG